MHCLLQHQMDKDMKPTFAFWLIITMSNQDLKDGVNAVNKDMFCKRN